MHWFNQDRFDVRLEWGTAAVRYAVKNVECIVIVDVMSFSTCVSIAVDNGAQVYPYPGRMHLPSVLQTTSAHGSPASTGYLTGTVLVSRLRRSGK